MYILLIVKNSKQGKYWSVYQNNDILSGTLAMTCQGPESKNFIIMAYLPCYVLCTVLMIMKKYKPSAHYRDRNGS